MFLAPPLPDSVTGSYAWSEFKKCSYEFWLLAIQDTTHQGLMVSKMILIVANKEIKIKIFD